MIITRQIAILGVLLLVFSGLFHWAQKTYPVKPKNKMKIAISTPQPTPTQDLVIVHDAESPLPLSLVRMTPSPSPSPSPSPTPLIPLSKVNAHILMYHYIGENKDPVQDRLGYNLNTPTDMLDQQISLLQQMGYHSASMADVVAGKGDRKTAVLTFDDGYEDFYTNAFPVLQQHGWTGTVYIVTGFIGLPGYMTWEQLQDLQAHGIEIGAHTIHHIDLATASTARAQTEIFTSKTMLEKMLNIKVTTFAYPSGRYNADTLMLIDKAGFASAVTTKEGVATIYNAPFELPRIRISPAISLSLLRKLMR